MLMKRVPHPWILVQTMRVDWKALVWRHWLSKRRPAATTKGPVVRVGRSWLHRFNGISTRFKLKLVASDKYHCRYAQLPTPRTMAGAHRARRALDDKADSAAAAASINGHSSLALFGFKSLLPNLC